MPKPETGEDRRKAGSGVGGRTTSPRGKPTFLERLQRKACAVRARHRDAVEVRGVLDVLHHDDWWDGWANESHAVRARVFSAPGFLSTAAPPLDANAAVESGVLEDIGTALRWSMRAMIGLRSAAANVRKSLRHPMCKKTPPHDPALRLDCHPHVRMKALETRLLACE